MTSQNFSPDNLVDNEPIGIIGAGPVGSLLSIYLARQGISSHIYERRSDIRLSNVSAGKSINLAVSQRGLYALKEIGLETHILNHSIPMRGRMIHSLDGNLNFQPYGIHDSDCIYSMSRSGLNQALMNHAEGTGKVKIHFHKKAINIDLNTNELELKDEVSNEKTYVTHQPWIATDGSTSVIRNELIQATNSHCSREFLDYGYKELSLPARTDGHFQIEKNALHIWPRGTYMLIALPNLDGSFTCTLFLPLQGKISFEALQTSSQISEFFNKQFPDIVSYIPNFLEQFCTNPIGQMVTVKCSSWHISDQLLLLGDAAHAIVPFFGQGMNCGFEDCTILNDLLNKKLKWNQIFSEFSNNRRFNTNSIADMAIENFIEMRDKVAQPQFLLEKKVEAILQKCFPGEYISRYALVTFSRISYQVAYQVGMIENEILYELCQNLDHAENVNLEKANFLIHTKLRPLIEAQKGLSHGS